MRKEPLNLLTIGGSDSGGAAGIQADLKTWTRLGAYGMSAITVVTAQNSEKIVGTTKLSVSMVYQQIESVLLDYGAAGVKTGMIGRVDLIEAIAPILRTQNVVVVDPVLMRHTGEPLFGGNVSDAYLKHLFPIATVITPNWREAAGLSGLSIDHPDDMKKAAQALHDKGAKNVAITGFPAGKKIVDLFSDGETMRHLSHRRTETNNVHGSGDTFSAAITYWLAHGRTLHESVEHAQQLTAYAIIQSAEWAICNGHGPIWH